MKKIISWIQQHRWFKIVLFATIGGVGGFAYYYFIGCQTGSCPLTGNPYISTSYGALLGFLFSLDGQRGKK
jgi:hypothetical protein